MKWRQVQTLVKIWNFYKLWTNRIEAWLRFKLKAREVWVIGEGSNGTKNGFPVILKEEECFEIQMRGPLGRYGYMKNGDLYVFHKKHIVRSGTIIVLWGKELWVNS